MYNHKVFTFNPVTFNHWNGVRNQAVFISFANFISVVFCDQAVDFQLHANTTCLETDVYCEVSVLEGGLGGQGGDKEHRIMAYLQQEAFDIA